MRRSQSLDRPLLALVALVLASTAARFALYRGVDAPWIAPDEQLYGLLGRSLLAGDGLTVLGESVPFYSLLYPLLVGLAFVGNDLAGGVTLVQALQAFLMSATAVPVFLWARPAVGWRWALVAGGLTVLIPGLAYGALFMSEALYYLVATVAVWALASCLHNPTLTRQALLLGAIGVALLTRLQAVGFAGAIVAAILVLAVSERSTAPVRRMRLTLAALGAVALVWTVSRVVLGGVGELLGAYAPLAEARSYSLADVAQSVAWQTGAVTIVTVGIPLVALAILAWGVLRGREADPYVRALVAAAASYIVVTIVEVGAFASRFVEHVTERQLLSVIPPAFVALVVWLHRGAPRPQPVASLAALLVAASALLLPLERVTTLAAYADAPSLIPLERLSRHLSQASFEAVYAAAVASVLLLAVFVPRRAAPALAGLVAVGLAVGSLVASREIRNGSHTERERTFAGAPRGWIDASGARDVTLLLTGERFWPSTWELIFWNESVGRIARFPGVLSPGAVPQDVVVPHVDGSLSTVEGADLDTAHVATSTDVMLVGERLASTPASFEQPGMALWRVTPPARLAQRIVGLRPNGDLHTGEAANIRVYACGPGRLELTLLGKEGKPTRVLVGGQVAAERAIPPQKVWRPSVPAPAIANGKKICVFTLETDGLVGSTRIEWVPSVGAG